MIRHINQQDCIGCGQCFKSCSLDVFRLDTDQPSRSPCMAACPAGTDTRAYNHLLQQGRLGEARDILKRTMPFPAITGRVCFHPCEKQCTRATLDESVNINALEQYLGDLDLAMEPPIPAHRHKERVAIVGSGPAGLAAAWFLTLAGYSTTVFEALPKPGGMLRYGIPAYRLPDAVVADQVSVLEKMGVRFLCNTPVGEDKAVTLDDLTAQGFHAVLLAPGLSVGKSLPLDGLNADTQGVWTGVEFLREIRSDQCGHSGAKPAIGRRVVVVGGGNVAIDAAISARRLGAEHVDLYCLEAADAMPAFAHNIREAQEEGVGIHPAFGPQRLICDANGSASGIIFAPCLRLFDDKGAWSPVFDTANLRTAEADSIILAIGQAADLAPFRAQVELTSNAHIALKGEIDAMTTSRPGVFAAGDVVSGPASVVEAIAGGRKAAQAMERYLKGQLLVDVAQEPLPVVDSALLKTKLAGKVPSLPRLERARVAATHGFDEACCGLNDAQAQAESMRCLTCGSKAYIAYNDDCMTCFSCELRCPADAVEVHPFKERLPYTLPECPVSHRTVCPEGGKA